MPRRCPPIPGVHPCPCPPPPHSGQFTSLQGGERGVYVVDGAFLSRDASPSRSKTKPRVRELPPHALPAQRHEGTRSFPWDVRIPHTCSPCLVWFFFVCLFLKFGEFSPRADPGLYSGAGGHGPAVAGSPRVAGAEQKVSTSQFRHPAAGRGREPPDRSRGQGDPDGTVPFRAGRSGRGRRGTFQTAPHRDMLPRRACGEPRF